MAPSRSNYSRRIGAYDVHNSNRRNSFVVLGRNMRRIRAGATWMVDEWIKLGVGLILLIIYWIILVAIGTEVVKLVW